MSLVGKMDGVSKGDLVLLKPSDEFKKTGMHDKAGYVLDFKKGDIQLTNTDPVEKIKINWKHYDESGEKKIWLPLDFFDSYQILKKYRGN